ETQRMTVLRKSPGLRYLSPDDLAALADAGIEVCYPPGALVQAPGRGGASVAVIADGTAGLWRCGELVGEVGPGEVVANRPPLDIVTRDSEVVARTPMRLVALPADAVASKLTHTAVTATILHAAVNRLRRADERSGRAVNEVHARP